LIVRKYKEAESIGSKYLFNYTDRSKNSKDMKLTYYRYQKCFTGIRDELKLNPDHRPHDGRTHFVTAAKKCKVDEYAIKYIVGHKISDLTEKVYTKREFNWLKEEMEKIK
jgi:integrase